MTHEGGVPRFAYNPEGKLTTREGYAYSYDGDGKRVMELNPGGKTTIWVGNYYEQSNQQSSNTFNETIYADGVRIGMRKNNQTNYWFHLDHLGGTHVITMSEGQFNSRDLYKAWGEERYSQGNTDTRYRYTGQMKEDDNLYYYGARWYDPSLGRFLQADKVLPIEQGIQGWDRYAYVNNCPTIFIDPNGNSLINPFNTMLSDGSFDPDSNPNQQITIIVCGWDQDHSCPGAIDGKSGASNLNLYAGYFSNDQLMHIDADDNNRFKDQNAAIIREIIRQNPDTLINMIGHSAGSDVVIIALFLLSEEDFNHLRAVLILDPTLSGGGRSEQDMQSILASNIDQNSLSAFIGLGKYYQNSTQYSLLSGLQGFYNYPQTQHSEMPQNQLVFRNYISFLGELP